MLGRAVLTSCKLERVHKTGKSKLSSGKHSPFFPFFAATCGCYLKQCPAAAQAQLVHQPRVLLYLSISQLREGGSEELGELNIFPFIAQIPEQEWGIKSISSFLLFLFFPPLTVKNNGPPRVVHWTHRPPVTGPWVS